MTYFRLQSDYYVNPKIVRVGPLAEVLYIRSIAYAQDNESDGFIPDCMLPVIGVGITDKPGNLIKLADTLVEAGLWEAADVDGWEVHNFLFHQPSHEKLEANRVRAREGMAELRAKKQAAGSPKKDLSRANGKADVTGMLQRNSDVTYNNVTPNDPASGQVVKSPSIKNRASTHVQGVNITGTHATPATPAPLELTDLALIAAAPLISNSLSLTNLNDVAARFNDVAISNSASASAPAWQAVNWSSKHPQPNLTFKEKNTPCLYEIVLDDDNRIKVQVAKLQILDEYLTDRWVRLRLREAYKLDSTLSVTALRDHFKLALAATTACYEAKAAGKKFPTRLSRYTQTVYRETLLGWDD